MLLKCKQKLAMTCYKTADVGLEEVRTERKQFVTAQESWEFWGIANSAFPGFGRIMENAIIIDLWGKNQDMEIVNFHLDSNWIIFPFEKSDYFTIKDM